MEEFYSLFYRVSLYGEQLYYHLRGWSDEEGGFVASLDKFPAIFWITFGAALLAFGLYYYFINHPRTNKWWCWTIVMLIVGVVGFFYGRGVVMADYMNGAIAESLQTYIGPGNALSFGFYNGFIGMAWFFLLSALFRRWSKNCKHSPFTLLTTKFNNKGAKDHE